MKVKDLRTMYETCVRSMEEFDEEAPVKIMFEYESDQLENEEMCIYDLDEANLLVGDDISTIAENYETIDEEVVLLVRAKKDNEVAQMLAEKTEEENLENMFEEHQFHFSFLPKTAYRCLDEFKRNFGLIAPKFNCNADKIQYNQLLLMHQHVIDGMMQRDLNRLLKSWSENESKIKPMPKEQVEKFLKRPPTAVQYFGNFNLAFIVYMANDFAVVVRKDLYINETDSLAITIPVPTRQECNIDIDQWLKALNEMTKDMMVFFEDIEKKEAKEQETSIINKIFTKIKIEHDMDFIRSIDKIIKKWELKEGVK